jgi:iron complex outermembrane receptor protein
LVKTFKTLYPTQPAARRAAFAVSSTATGCALLLLAASSTASAADQPGATAAAPAPLEEVVVTGIRAAIQSAISVKKNANSIVEAISAEDIGKLPDTTIAESLARLPGVTTQRDRDGNATNVSIRGLGPDFNGYLLNGREQTSTGDSRASDLSVYPAELIAGATVYKSGDAGLMTAGLAGTIDNHLVDPLAYHGLVIAANAERTKNGVGLKAASEGTGKRYSLSFIDQFADRKLGIAIGFVHSDTTSSSLANGSWGSSPAVYSDNGVTQIANGTGLPSVNVPFGGGLSYETDHKTDKRNGGALILEFKPTDSFTSEADYYYAKIKTGLKKMAVKGATFGGAITNATINGGVVDTGTFHLNPDGLIAYSENLFDDDTIQSLGWKNTLKMSDDWTGSLDYNHNSAKRVEKDIEAYGGVNAADTLSFTNGGGTPQFTVGSPTSYTDPATIQIRDQSGWSGVQYKASDLPPGDPNVGRTVPQAGYNKGPTVTDKLDAFRLDFTHKFGGGHFTDIQLGANYTKRSKDRITDEGVIASATNDGYDRITYPAGAYVESNVGSTGLNLLTFDPQVGLWQGAVVIRKYNDDILSKTWTVEEKATTGYAKLNFDTTAGATPIRGNLGVQIVNTDQSSGGYRADVNSSVTLSNPAGTLTTDGTKFTDVLPSFNIAADMGGNGLLRFASSIQIARPNLTDMRNSLAVALDTDASHSSFGTLVGSSGNPHLKPFKAKAFDVSWEKYFDHNKAYVSAALFYKVLETYITPATNYGGYDFTQIAGNLGLAIPPAGALGTYTTTVNGSGGDLRGIELAGSLPFDLMASWLEGFGITASYSSTMSSVELPNLIGLNPSQQVPASGLRMPLPGLSHINEKAVFYYERAGFSAFVADNYRSQYIGSVANSQVGGYPALVLILPQQWISAQAGYEFQSGALKGLGLRFEANNLNKPKYREVQADRSIHTNETGAVYAFKLLYKFQ